MQALLVIDRLFRGEPVILPVPAAFEDEIQPGSMVLAGFQNSREKLFPGYVLEVSPEESAPGNSGPVITDLLYGGKPVLQPDQLRLALWMADYYLTSPLDTVLASLPAAVRTTVHDIAELNDFALKPADRKTVSTTLRRSILQLLANEKKLTVPQLQKKLGRKQLYRTLSELEKGGYITLRKRFETTRPKRKTAYLIAKTNECNPEELLGNAPRQLDAFRALVNAAEPAFAETLGVSAAVLNELVKKGIAEKTVVDIRSNFRNTYSEIPKTPDRLTLAQEKALCVLGKAAETEGFSAFLLHGVTGSGKTLIYIELLKKVLAAGRTAIVLVPEISLTPQTAGRFHHHFHDDITILHSAMSDQEKYDAWHSLRSGSTKIALGARSTIFAPLENVGAIIVDEEHDGAYKQDRNPRYHARDTAVMRAMLDGAVCVLGSATPSFESYQNARSGKYGLIRLPDRIDGARMPKLTLISMKEAPKATASISERLFREIRKRLEKNEQVILLQNRRGFSGSVFCLDCGHTSVCRFCNIPLVFHATEMQLRCHYCGHTQLFTEQCIQCGSANLFYKSSGTERIEEELKTLFPDENILRMDIDTTSTKGAHGRILKTFHEKKSRILLGTQMVAKGLDFPDVSLVGVLMADIGLNIPDFRAAERMYSLLTQVAGRAGRAAIAGEVYLQVYNLENQIFRSLLEGSYEQFFEREMTMRSALLYPPAARLVKFEFSSPEEKSTGEAALSFKKELETHLSHENVVLLGPAPAGLARLRGRYRYQLLVKILSGKLAPPFIRHCIDRLLAEYRTARLSVSIDVDPQNLM